MAPLDCNDFVTAWIPLEEVPAKREGGSPLVFASRSHRDFALNHWRDSRLREDLSGRYREKDHAPLAAGNIKTLLGNMNKCTEILPIRDKTTAVERGVLKSLLK